MNKWRLSNLSELTTNLFSMELTHLGLEAFKLLISQDMQYMQLISIFRYENKIAWNNKFVIKLKLFI